jgi:hypothetical protein
MEGALLVSLLFVSRLFRLFFGLLDASWLCMQVCNTSLSHSRRPGAPARAPRIPPNLHFSSVPHPPYN